MLRWNGSLLRIESITVYRLVTQRSLRDTHLERSIAVISSPNGNLGPAGFKPILSSIMDR